MSDYTSRFGEWQNYVHYLLNALFLVSEGYLFQFYYSNTFIMILWTALLIFVNDSIIHALFWYLPEPIRWRD